MLNSFYKYIFNMYITFTQYSITFTHKLFFKEVDLSTYLFEMTTERMNSLEITYPEWIVSVSLLQRFPNEESRLKIQIKPFTLTVNDLK